VPALLLAYPVVGNINLYLLQDEFHLYPMTEPYQPNVAAMLGTLALIAATVPAFRGTVELAPKRELDHERLNTISLLATAAGCVINLANYAAVGGVPLLRGNLDGYERFEVTAAMPLPSGLVLSSAFVAVNVIALLGRRRWQAPRLHL